MAICCVEVGGFIQNLKIFEGIEWFFKLFKAVFPVFSINKNNFILNNLRKYIVAVHLHSILFALIQCKFTIHIHTWTIKQKKKLSNAIKTADWIHFSTVRNSPFNLSDDSDSPVDSTSKAFISYATELFCSRKIIHLNFQSLDNWQHKSTCSLFILGWSKPKQPWPSGHSILVLKIIAKNERMNTHKAEFALWKCFELIKFSLCPLFVRNTPPLSRTVWSKRESALKTFYDEKKTMGKRASILKNRR